MFAQRVTITRVRVTHFTHYPIYNFSIYWLFLSVNCIGSHSVVDILVDFEPTYPGFESGESHTFFLIIFFCHYYYSANLQIQHYCLYSDSPTLLLLMMPRPPALWLAWTGMVAMLVIWHGLSVVESVECFFLFSFLFYNCVLVGLSHCGSKMWCLGPVKHVQAPSNLLLTISRRYFCCGSLIVHVVMVSSNMVTQIAAAHYASCLYCFCNLK